MHTQARQTNNIFQRKYNHNIISLACIIANRYQPSLHSSTIQLTMLLVAFDSSNEVFLYYYDLVPSSQLSDSGKPSPLDTL